MSLVLHEFGHTPKYQTEPISSSHPADRLTDIAIQSHVVIMQVTIAVRNWNKGGLLMSQTWENTFNSLSWSQKRRLHWYCWKKGSNFCRSVGSFIFNTMSCSHTQILFCHNSKLLYVRVLSFFFQKGHSFVHTACLGKPYSLQVKFYIGMLLRLEQTHCCDKPLVGSCSDQK